IQDQARKVELEVRHLQTLLDHWANAPCTVAREPPTSPSGSVRSRGRRGCGRSVDQAHHHRSPRRQPEHRRSPVNRGGWGSPHRSAQHSGWGSHHHSPPPVQRDGWDSGKVPRLALAISPNQQEDKDEEVASGWPPLPDGNDLPGSNWEDKGPPPPPASMFAAAA
ncbi:hypothetical protein KI387_038961, partial [Taxus chinensis]